MRECQALNAFQIQVPSPTQSALEKLAIYAKMKLNVTVPKLVQVKDAHVKRLKSAVAATVTQRIHHVLIVKWIKKNLICR